MGLNHPRQTFYPPPHDTNFFQFFQTIKKIQISVPIIELLIHPIHPMQFLRHYPSLVKSGNVRGGFMGFNSSPHVSLGLVAIFFLSLCFSCRFS